MQQQQQQISNLIRGYATMPGLVQASFGVLFILSGVLNLFWTKWLYYVIEHKSPLLANTLAIISLFLPFALYLLCLYAVKRYYNRHVGQVQASTADKKTFGLELAGTIVSFFLLMNFIDIRYHTAISTSLLVLAAFFGVHWYLLARQQYHYVLLALVTVALSMAPLFSPVLYHWLFMDKAPDWYSNNIALVTGCLLLIAGLIDHMLLVRRMARVRREIQRNILTTKAIG